MLCLPGPHRLNEVVPSGFFCQGLTDIEKNQTTFRVQFKRPLCFFALPPTGLLKLSNVTKNRSKNLSKFYYHNVSLGD